MRHWEAFRAKMAAEGLSEAAVAAFKHNYEKLASGADLNIPESSIKPVDDLPSYDSLPEEVDAALLDKTVLLKLNGGLGTGMGLDSPKSLLPLRGGASFLDFICTDVSRLRAMHKRNVKFMLMNSFVTQQSTADALAKRPDFEYSDFLQNQAPKVDASDLKPATWEANPTLEWCPPGHGDLYPAMLGSGRLESLLEEGYRYMFVSNSDNVGATLDLKLLTWFAQSGSPFAMEVAARTEADKKGGHLARDKKSGGLLLRESAQCPAQDEAAFQDVTKHRYFNTNNLWLDLEALKATMKENGGVLPLPVMKNGKTVDPRNKASTKVLQLETAMGAAIASFPGAQAILIPRERFAPVKATSDLLSMMSDAYAAVDGQSRVVLDPEREGVPPEVQLDGRYKFVDALMEMVPSGPPSLIGCDRLTVEGHVVFGPNVVVEGDVRILNSGKEARTLDKGFYRDCTIDLTAEDGGGGEAPGMPDWRRAPDGIGFVKLAPGDPGNGRPIESDDALPFGWIEDPDGTGITRLPADDERVPTQPGYWAKLVDLDRNWDMNGLLVEIVNMEPDDQQCICVKDHRPELEIAKLGFANCRGEYYVKPENLAPVEGSEKVAPFHEAVDRLPWTGGATPRSGKGSRRSTPRGTPTSSRR